MFDLKGKIRVKISEQTICQRYISKYYPNGIVVPNLKIIPPYDKGLDGSFYIYERNNQVWWNNEDTKQKGCLFSLLQKTYKLNYQEVLTMIDFDFKLGLVKNNVKTDNYASIKLTNDTEYFKNGHKTNAYFKLEEAINRILYLNQFKIKSTKNLLYESFKAFGISEEVINDFELFELENGKMNTAKFSQTIQSTKDYHLFAYRLGHQIKIINPTIEGTFKKFAHIGRKGSKYIFGLKQLKRRKSKVEKLLIVMAEIEVIALTVNGYDAVCICGNDGILTKGLLKELSFAEKIIFLSQGNEEGEKIAFILSEKFGIPSINYQNLNNHAAIKTT